MGVMGEAMESKCSKVPWKNLEQSGRQQTMIRELLISLSLCETLVTIEQALGKIAL